MSNLPVSVHALTELIRERLGRIDWELQSWRWVGETGPGCDKGIHHLVGAVYPPKTKGKYKGTPNWKNPEPGTFREVFITPEEATQFVLGFEQKTGSCYKCALPRSSNPVGQTFKSWSKDEGVKYVTCSRCQGTGKAPAQEGGEA